MTIRGVEGGLEQEALTQAVIGGAIEVHRSLGPGVLESAYEQCLAIELSTKGLSVVRRVHVPVVYRGVQVDAGYRVDMLVDDAVVLEIKAVEKVLPVHEAQLMTYMRLRSKSVGLLLNLRVAVMALGITRRVLSLPPSASPRLLGS